jgi:hypothetical protein
VLCQQQSHAPRRKNSRLQAALAQKSEAQVAAGVLLSAGADRCCACVWLTWVAQERLPATRNGWSCRGHREHGLAAIPAAGISHAGCCCLEPA